MLKLPDGRLKVLVQGVAKARISSYVRKRSWFRVKIEILEEPPVSEVNLETEALMRNVREFSEKILALRGEMSGDVTAILESIDDPGRLAENRRGRENRRSQIRAVAAWPLPRQSGGFRSTGRTAPQVAVRRSRDGPKHSSARHTTRQSFP